jgi:methylase of polypeptide subunit release factors
VNLPRLRELLLAAGYQRTASLPAFSSKHVHPLADRLVARRIAAGNPLPLACHSRPSRFLAALPAALQRWYRVLYLHEQVPCGGLEELLELGLVESIGEGLCQSRYQLTAVGERFIFSSIPGRTPGAFVYLGDDSGHLIEAARGLARGRIMDICCGCGVVGLALPGTEVEGLDANPAGIELAGWNASLNNSPMIARQSDLWSEARGCYDFVIGNPPALPLTDPHPDLLFARGGSHPTDLTCRTVEGLHRHLAPGGRCLLLSFSVGHQLWDDLQAVLAPSWSLQLRVRASHPLPVGRWLHHLWIDIRNDGQGRRQRLGPSLEQRLLNWHWPLLRAEKPAQQNYLRFGKS